MLKIPASCRAAMLEAERRPPAIGLADSVFVALAGLCFIIRGWQIAN